MVEPTRVATPDEPRDFRSESGDRQPGMGLRLSFRTRLTIALGCTGGYHRSIALTEELATWLKEQNFGPVAVFHRELDRA